MYRLLRVKRFAFRLAVLGLLSLAAAPGQATERKHLGEVHLAGSDASLDEPLWGPSVIHSQDSALMIRLDNGRKLTLAANSSALFDEVAPGAVEVRVAHGLVVVRGESGKIASAGQNSRFVLEPANPRSLRARAVGPQEPVEEEGDDDFLGGAAAVPVE